MQGSLVQSCQAGFSADLRFAGQLLARAGVVDLQSVTEHDVAATVPRHGIDYRVALLDYADPRSRRFTCSCRPTAAQSRCAHVFATLVAVDELLAEIATSEAALGAELAAAPVAKRRPNPRRAARPDWRQRVAPALPAPATAEPVPLPVLEYYVAAGGYRDDDALTIEVRFRSPKKNGELSAPRAGRIDDDIVQRLPAADRSLLEWMQRDLPARYDHYSYAGWRREPSVSLSTPWFVQTRSLPLLLPWLRATGRVYRAPVPTAHQVATPLRIDTERPFEFELTVARPDANGNVAVHGVLRRDDEQITYAGMAVRDEHYAIVDDRLLRIVCHGAAPLVRVFATGGPLELPAAELPQLLGELAAVRGAGRFLQPCLQHLPATAPIGVVMLTFASGVEAPLRAQVKFDYAGVLVAAGDERPVVVGDGEAPLRRDLDAERVLHGHALAAGLSPALGGELCCPRAQLTAVTLALQQAGLRVFAAGQRVRPFVRGKGTVGSGIDWLEVGAEVEFDGHLASLPELLRRRITPEGFVELDDGSVGLLPERWLRQVEALRLLGGEIDGDLVRLPGSQSLLLDAMLAARDDASAFAVDKQFAALRRRLAKFTSVAAADAPASFAGDLRPYQRVGLGWLAFLHQFRLGGCLADDMGLGKTVQVLAHLLALRRGRGRARPPSLLVAPRSVLGNWLAEARRFAPDLSVLDFSGADRWRGEVAAAFAGSDLVLTTYALARADAPRFAEAGQRFHYVILDEAQAIKNADSQNSKAVRLLHGEHRLALTGTPVENHLGELWALFEFLNPGMLGRLPAFRGLFAKDADRSALAAHRELVQRALRPVLLRRTKAQVLQDLPEKIEQTLWCDLEPGQRQRYEELRVHYQQRLLAGGGELDGRKRFVVLEALLRLRQAACHEGLLDRQRRGAESAKFEELLPRLEDLAAEGHKALVFSQFTSLLDLLEPQLRQRKLTFERLDGRTKNRSERVERFQQDPACPVFLISLKAGGFGLNLTAAGYVFLLDPWWNPAVEMQAIDRAHRIGQKRSVHAYRVVCRGTVEERVLELQQQKRELCEAILGNERSLLQDLTRQDLELLLA